MRRKSRGFISKKCCHPELVEGSFIFTDDNSNGIVLEK
jgi:hypothetical protein